MSRPTDEYPPSAEVALEPAQPLCDPHHHLWEDDRNPYGTGEFLADIGGGHRVVSTIYVECQRGYRTEGPARLRPVGETEYVHGLTRLHQDSATRIAAGIVGFADLTLGAGVEEVLVSHLAASARFRGIRHASAWDPDPGIHSAHSNPPPGLLADRRFREGFSRLAAHKLIFDAWLYFPQLPELADLARAFPGTPIVLNHAGGPIGIGPYAGQRQAVREQWQSAMAGLARCANVFVKFGGLGMKMAGFAWHRRVEPPSSADLASSWAPYFATCMEYFGSKRCMFESNFPIDRVACSYTVLWNAFKRLAAGATAAERAALCHDTAARIYRLDQ